MNPHFIFNSLTAIQNTILKNDQLKSAELIAVFSKLIRQNLDFSNRNRIRLTEEVDMLTNYITTQQFRFENIFTYKINIDDEINCDGVEIPPMLIQPFVENAIEHGLKNKKKGGKIEINFIKKTEDELCIIIKDNGLGYYISKKEKKEKINIDKTHALDIFKKRLEIRQKNEEKSFNITELVNNKNKIIGTKVTFCLKV